MIRIFCWSLARRTLELGSAFRRCTHIENTGWYLVREWFPARCAAIVEIIVFIYTGFAVLRGLIDVTILGNFPKFAVAVVRLHQSCSRLSRTQAMAFRACRPSPPAQ